MFDLAAFDTTCPKRFVASPRTEPGILCLCGAYNKQLYYTGTHTCCSYSQIFRQQLLTRSNCLKMCENDFNRQKKKKKKLCVLQISLRCFYSNYNRDCNSCKTLKKQTNAQTTSMQRFEFLKHFQTVEGFKGRPISFANYSKVLIP